MGYAADSIAVLCSKILGHASEPLPLFLFDALVVSRVPLRPQYICTGGAHRERRRAIYGTWKDAHQVSVVCRRRTNADARL